MPSVLSVGQCGLDHSVLSRYLSEHFNAEVVRVQTEADAVRRLEQTAYDLILVNRKLDVDGSDGVEIVRRLQASAQFAQCPVMLVSNYADAQSAAVEAGAALGFGKSAYDDPNVRDRLGRFLGEREVPGEC